MPTWLTVGVSTFLVLWTIVEINAIRFIVEHNSDPMLVKAFGQKHLKNYGGTVSWVLVSCLWWSYMIFG